MGNKNCSIILGGGCFWCIEAALQRLEGILQITSGYAGGFGDSPDYRSVCSGQTGHAEVVLAEWNAAQISLNEILTCFFAVHDPTSLNRQGNDVGTQYRSFIGYFTDEQLRVVDAYIGKLNQQLNAPIVTEKQLAPTFYPAEIEHQNYYNLNSQQPYCQIVIRPKVEKIEQILKG
ncbi:peptide-methionine (S)-S-oxide reductase MsrA [Aliikangiella maris]|uniref:Peptide methionine sulfoxide reductase MsrA n=2 Tax=Aliikangiella maris TaxID=3162458 RepID=A0ABV3MU21_9GAMM